MGWVSLPLLLVGALALLLLAAGIEDVRRRTIANGTNAAIALLAPVWWWASEMGGVAIAVQVVLALIVFALFVGAFAAGWMGGGDVKMIGALALWLPAQGLVAMLILMSVIGGVLSAVMWAEARWRQAGAGGAATAAAIEVPYGVAIALAGLLSLPKTGF